MNCWMPQPMPKASCYAEIYQHSNFHGWKAQFPIGQHDYHMFLQRCARNDDASSIKVFGPGCKAIVYQHAGFGGWQAEFTTGAYPMRDFMAHGAKNDDASSVKVMQEPTPQPTELDLKMLTQALHAFMESSNIIDQINAAMRREVPQTIVFDDVKAEADGNHKIFSVWGVGCDVGYKVSAQLKGCTNLNRAVVIRQLFEPSNVLTRDSNGNILVTLTPTIQMPGFIQCFGEASARGGACGININARAKEMKAGARIQRIGAMISATVESGSNGKMCLKVKSIKGNVNQRDVKWQGFSMKFMGLPFAIPGSLIDEIWRKLPLSKPINKAVSTLTDTLKDELDKMSLCV